MEGHSKIDLTIAFMTQTNIWWIPLSLRTKHPNAARCFQTRRSQNAQCSHVSHSISLTGSHCGRSSSPSAPPNVSPAQQSYNLTLHSPTGNQLTEWFFADMSQPRYLTGDKAGIQEFLDKFDVCTSSLAGGVTDKPVHRCSYSTAMVRPHSILIYGTLFYLFSILSNNPKKLRASPVYRAVIRTRSWLWRRIGVLWSGDHLFPKVAETIEMLRSQGSGVALLERLTDLTNMELQASNSSLSPTTAPNLERTIRRSLIRWVFRVKWYVGAIMKISNLRIRRSLGWYR